MFRGFLNDAPQLTFVTDLRSSKLADLAKSSWVEVCWYFPVTHEQFRIGGLVKVVGEETTDGVLSAARLECWRALPEPTRLSFTWPVSGEPAMPTSLSRPGTRIPTRLWLTSACWCSTRKRSTCWRSMGTHKTAGSITATNLAAGWEGKSTREESLTGLPSLRFLGRFGDFGRLFCLG